MATQPHREKEDVVRFLFVGSPLLDITAYCEQNLLHKYGLKSDDCILATEKHEDLFQTLFHDPNSKIVAGGSSQNTARIVKWVLGDKGDVAFSGCVGVDDFSSKMGACLESEGVLPLYIPLKEKPTGTCACLITSVGERSMCTKLGAGQDLNRDHLLTKKVWERLSEAHCIFVEGYVLGHSPDVMTTLVEKCWKNQVLSISLSAEYICREYAHRIMDCLHRIDILFGNEAEAKTLAAALGMKEDAKVEDIATVLSMKDRAPCTKPRIVIITRGSKPILVVQGTSSPQYFPVQTNIQIVDTVGCGDAIAGGFLAVYTLTGDVKEAARTAILAASEIAQVRGCSPTKKVLYPLAE